MMIIIIEFTISSLPATLTKSLAASWGISLLLATPTKNGHLRARTWLSLAHPEGTSSAARVASALCKRKRHGRVGNEQEICNMDWYRRCGAIACKAALATGYTIHLICLQHVAHAADYLKGCGPDFYVRNSTSYVAVFCGQHGTCHCCRFIGCIALRFLRLFPAQLPLGTRS